MKNYLDLLRNILENGVEKTDRTGTGTISLNFPPNNLWWDLSKGFPVVTTKKIHTKSVIHELLWMLSGSTNVKYLNDNGVTIWSEWSDSNGDLGKTYGHQFRKWEKFTHTPLGDYDYCDSRADIGEHYTVDKIDQIQVLVDSIKKTPDSRRLMVSTWNVADLNEMRLPPCHYGFQVLISGDRLDLQWRQRSIDTFLGLPFNIAFYAILTHMLAQVTGYKPGILSVSMGDAHIYKNHIEQVRLQLTREPYPLPTLRLNPNVKNIFDFKYEDITLEDYQHHPLIKAPVAI